MATAVPAASPVAVPDAAPPPVVATDGTDIAPVTASEPRVVKPIPSRPRLPGVDPDIEALPSAEPPSSAERDPLTGRFKAAGDPATSDNRVDTLEPSPATTPKFKMAGEEWESQAAFEKNFKTLRGNFKPLQVVAKQVGGIEQVVPTLMKAAESARTWEAEAKRLSAELETARSGQPALPNKGENVPNKGTDAPESINEELYAEIRRLAIESGEPWKAQEWLTGETNRLLEARMQKMLDERFKPLVDEQEYQNAMEKTGELFGSLADLRQSDGSVAYPELHDPVQARNVGLLWRRMGLPPEHALTHAGAIAAIGLHRMVNAGLRGSQAASPQAIASPAGEAPVTDGGAAASLTDGRTPVVHSGNGAVSNEAAAILSALRQTNNTGKRAVLGFDA